MKKDNKQENNNTEIKDLEKIKEKKSNKIIEIIKKKWLIDTTLTIALVIMIIAAFIGINVLLHNLDMTPLDFTQDKLYTLTEESKEQIKKLNIENNLYIYFLGYGEEDTTVDLTKQYSKINDKIIVEPIKNVNDRPDLVSKYGIQGESQGIILEYGNKSKVLSKSDLYTYDTATYKQIDIAEEKFTSSIKALVVDKIPKVYFLAGYSEFSIKQNMNSLYMYLENEINEVEQLDILAKGKVPDDCDVLVITTPNKDFDDVALNAITDYINSGKNILWFNAAITEDRNLPNVNKILDMYGVKPFEKGLIRETDTNHMVSGSNDLIIPEIQHDEVTENLVNSTGVIFINATKINVDEDRLDDLNVEKHDLLLTSEKSYFRKEFKITSNEAEDDEEKGKFVVGAELNKTIKEANEENGENKIESKLIIYGENYFISDYQLSQNSQYGAIQLAYNKDLVIDSISALSNKEEEIKARKATNTVTYTATEKQDLIVKIVIFVIPVLIIIAGIVVWQKRRRKK